jgi:hypothetical protein
MASLGVGGAYAPSKPDRSPLRKRAADNAKSGAGTGVAPAASGITRSAGTASGGAASACSSLSSSLSALAAPMEIMLSQLQFTGLTSSVFYAMVALPDAAVPPAISAAWSTVLGWTDLANLDSLGVAAMLQALPATQALNAVRLQVRNENHRESKMLCKAKCSTDRRGYCGSGDAPAECGREQKVPPASPLFLRAPALPPFSSPTSSSQAEALGVRLSASSLFNPLPSPIP